MAVLIGHASISENGGIYGIKGDSTGREVCIRNWYSHPWDYMAIHPNAAVREKHAKAVEDACNNDNIGYGQGDRNTANTEAKKVNYNISKIKTKCNTDCSALQNLAAVVSGAKGVSYGGNGWTTSTMKEALKAAGYKIIKSKNYIADEKHCVRGAIYVKAGSHTVCGLTNGSNANSTLKHAGITVGSETVNNNSNKQSSTANREDAESFDKSIAGTYEVKSSTLNVRIGASSKKDKVIEIPKGTKVQNYGYYTINSTSKTKWLLLQFKYNNNVYIGFGNIKGLKKV